MKKIFLLLLAVKMLAGCTGIDAKKFDNAWCLSEEGIGNGWAMLVFYIWDDNRAELWVNGFLDDEDLGDFELNINAQGTYELHGKQVTFAFDIDNAERSLFKNYSDELSELLKDDPDTEAKYLVQVEYNILAGLQKIDFSGGTYTITKLTESELILEDESNVLEFTASEGSI